MLSEFEQIMTAALSAAQKVPCSRSEYVEGLEMMQEMLDADLAAARDSARGEDD